MPNTGIGGASGTIIKKMTLDQLAAGAVCDFNTIAYIVRINALQS
jgi:hypothetical protein